MSTLGPRPEQARPVIAPPPRTPRSSRPLVVAISGVVVAVAVVAGIGAMGHNGGAPATRPPAATPTASIVAADGAGSGTATTTGSPGGAPTTTPTQAATSSASAAVDPSSAPTLLPAPIGRQLGGVLIADRMNGRLLAVTMQGRITWEFPVAGSLAPGRGFEADDAFISPDGKSIVANEEHHDTVVRIDIATRRVIWEYGTYDVKGAAPGQLSSPDDAYPLANGDVVVADIGNCRIQQINPDKQLVRQWGTTGVCVHHPPDSYDKPNGDTPLPDGGMLVTEIGGARVVRLSASGKVIFDIHVPAVYPSDAQLDRNGNVVVADYHTPGSVLVVSPTGRLLYRYGPTTGTGALSRPSLALPLIDGRYLVNDDFRERVVIIDPRTSGIDWTYGQTDQRGKAPGLLHVPDGVDVIPPGHILLGTPSP